MEKITKNQILNQLEAFEHVKGRIVTVHTSLKAVGEIEGGGETLLDALIEFFTDKGGLLCVPTHTWDRDVYDRRESYSCIGVMPRLAAAHPEGIRTLHPTHSMAIFGEKERAERFAAADAIVVDTPASPKCCYGRLYSEDGYVLLLGVGHNKNTYLHCVEETLGTPNRYTEHKLPKTIIHKDGTEEVRYLHWFNGIIPDVSVYFTKFEEPFRYYGCIEDGVIGNAKVQLCNARKMFSVVERIYKNNNFKELLDNDLPIDKKLYM